MDSKIRFTYTTASVQHDPVSGPDFAIQTGTGSDWISKKLNRIRYGYPNCQSFFGYKPDWTKYLERLTGLRSDRITQWKFWTGWGLQKSPIFLTLTTRDGTGSRVPESTPAGFCVFLSDPDPDSESKIFQKQDPVPEWLFHFRVVGVYVVISWVKTWANFGSINDCSQSLKRSRILRFEELPDADSQSLEQERSRSLKSDSGHIC